MGTIVNRPWGSYEILALEEDYWIKILRIKAGHRTSLQSHKNRKEYWKCISGLGTAEVENWDGDLEIHILQEGLSVTIPLETKHRITASDESEELIICEVALGKPTEDDITRYEDDYGRVK